VRDTDLDHHDVSVAETVEILMVDIEVVHPLMDQAPVIGFEIPKERVGALGGLYDSRSTPAE